MKGKVFRRIIHFASGSLFGFLPVVFLMILSWVVVTCSGLAIWGEFMEYSIWVNAAVAIAGWGTKDFLLKKFSEQPSQVHKIWNVHIASRGLLYLLGFPLIFLFNFDAQIGFGMAMWYLVMALVKLFDPLIFYLKSVKEVIWVEPFVYGMIGLVLWFNPSFISGRNLLSLMVIIQVFKLGYFVFLFKSWFQLMHLKFQKSYWVESFPYFIPVIAGYLFWKVDTLVGTYFLSKTELGKYALLQSILNFYPGLYSGGLSIYQKNYNRLGERATHIFNNQSMLLGLGGAIVYSCLSYAFLNYVYELNFQISVLGLSLLQLLPFVLYYPIILQLIKHNLQSLVAWVTTGLSLFGLMICILFAQKATFMGVFIAFIVFQWVAFIVYFLLIRKIKQKLEIITLA